MNKQEFFENLANQTQIVILENNKDFTEIDNLLKSYSQSQARMGTLIISSAAKEVVAKELKDLSKEDILELGQYADSTEKQNCINTLSAVYDEPGLIYVLTYCKLAVCNECIRCAEEIKKTEKEKNNKKGFFSRLFSKNKEENEKTL